jgi:tetratricopeptide (TPR) repeat protein
MFRFKSLILFMALLCAMPVALRAEDEMENLPDAPPQAKEASKKIVEPSPLAGELRVDGKVTMLNGKGSFNIEVQSFTTAQGKTVPLETPKPKTITTDASTRFYPRGDDKTKMSVTDVKLGTRVTVVGKDLGSGKELPAREIMLWIDLNEGKSIGVVHISHSVGVLIDAGDAQRDARNYPEALRIYGRAQGTASGSGDRPGQALSLSRMAGIYSRNSEHDKAIEAYSRALGIWRSLNDADGQALTLNNLAMAYANNDQNDKAQESMESAVSLAQNSSDKKLRTLTWANLGGVYLSADKYELALSAFEKALPLVRGQADRSDEGRILSRLALSAARASQTEKANEYLEAGANATGAMLEKNERADALQVLGLAAADLDQRDKARDFFNRAISAYGEIGDTRSVEETRRYLARLDGGNAPDENTAAEETNEAMPEQNEDGEDFEEN